MFLVTIGYRCVSVTKQTLGHRRSHFCRPDLQFGVEELETMMSHTNKWFDHAMYTCNKFHKPINRVRHGWNHIEMFSLTHALHTDGRRLVMNLEHISIHNNDWASHATSPQCRAECASEIHSHVNCHSTMTGARHVAIEHGFESPKHRVSLRLSTNSYVHRDTTYAQAQ